MKRSSPPANLERFLSAGSVLGRRASWDRCDAEDVEALADEPPKIGASLDPIRAAISLVADGVAQRVTVSLPSAATVMPAARQLARAAGVQVELVGAVAPVDVIVRSDSARGA
jgi:hypothetical protein